MNPKTKLSFICGGAASLIFGAAGGIMYYFAHTRSYEKDIHHFDFSSPYPLLMTVFFALAIAACILCAVFAPRKSEVACKAPDTGCAFTLWFAAFVLFSFGLLSLSRDAALHSDTAFGIFCSKAAPILCALSAVPAVLCLSSRLRGTDLHVVSAFVPLLWCGALLFKYYFDISEIPLNDPELTLTVVSLSALAMFWLSECRLAIGILTPAFAVFSTLPAATVASAVAVVRIILYAKEGYTAPSIYENIPFLAVSLLAAVRFAGIHGAIRPKADEPEETKSENKLSA